MLIGWYLFFLVDWTLKVLKHHHTNDPPERINIQVVLKCLKLVFFKYWAFLCLPQNVVFAARFRSNQSFSMKLSHQKLFCMIYNWRDRATKTTVTENDKIIIIKKWKANVESCSTLFGRCLCHHRTTNDTVTLSNMIGKAMSIAIVLTSIFLPTFPHNFSQTSDSYCSLNCLQNSLPGVNILIEPSSKYTINETNTHTLSSRKLRDKVVALMSHFFLVTSLTKMKPPTLKLFIDVK